MLSLDKNKVSVFDLKPMENMKNCYSANISSSKKEAEDKFSYQSWNARFVGAAFEKAKDLQDKDRIELTKSAVENVYVKAKDKAYLTVVIFDFEKIEK